MSIIKISELEHKMVHDASKDYGEYWVYANEAIHLLQNFVDGVAIEAQAFSIFLSQIQKSSTLAVLSTLRRHDVQALIMIRHLSESTVLAAYSLVEYELNKYIYTSKNGYAMEKKDIKKRAYKWIEKEYPDISKRIKLAKDQINDLYAHANLLSAFTNYKISEENNIVLEFFDKKDDVFTKQRLWWIGNISFGIIDLITKVNRKHSLISTKDISNNMLRLMMLNNKLQEELMKLPNFSAHIGKTLE